MILFIDSKTSAELHVQPGGKILIASLGGEIASHESLKRELQHSGSSKIEYWGDLMEATDFVRRNNVTKLYIEPAFFLNLYHNQSHCVNL